MNRWLNNLIKERGKKVFCDSYSFDDLGRLAKQIRSPPDSRIIISEKNSIHLLAKIKSAWDNHSTPVLLSPNLSHDIRSSCINLLKKNDRVVDEGMIVFTSATSSMMPKGVILTHSNLENHLQMLSEHVPVDFLSTNDRTIPLLPWTHCYGLMGECFSMMERGGQMFNGNYFVRANLNKPTILFVVPKIIEKFLRINQKLEKYFFVKDARRIIFGPKIRFLVSGGAHLPNELISEFRKQFQIDIYQGYGCTEMSPMIALETEFPNNQTFKILPNIELRLDKNEEIHVNGPNRFYGYLGEPPLPVNEFYKTGDIGKLVTDNRMMVTGRSGSKVKLKNGYFVDLAHEEDKIKNVVKSAHVCLWEEKGDIRGIVYKPQCKIPCGIKEIKIEPTIENGMLTIKGEMRREKLKTLYNKLWE